MIAGRFGSFDIEKFGGFEISKELPTLLLYGTIKVL